MRIDIGNPEVTISTNILEIEIPKIMEKAITTGNRYFDALCSGDGMIPSTVMLLTGVPGSGKTTMAAQIADGITSKGNVCLFNTCEESLVQLRKTVKRLNLPFGFIPSYFNELTELFEHADKVKAANPDKQLFLIIDSLQTLEWQPKEQRKGRPAGPELRQEKIAWEIANWTKQNFGITIIIGQVNKDGTFQGKQGIKHAVDCHLHLDFDKDRRSESYGERVAEMQKNRFGCAGLWYPFNITASGIMFKDS